MKARGYLIGLLFVTQYVIVSPWMLQLVEPLAVKADREAENFKQIYVNSASSELTPWSTKTDRPSGSILKEDDEPIRIKCPSRKLLKVRTPVDKSSKKSTEEGKSSGNHPGNERSRANIDDPHNLPKAKIGG